jgi:beta-glucanase (GH16 family)
MLKTIYPFSFLALATLGMALYACSHKTSGTSAPGEKGVPWQFETDPVWSDEFSVNGKPDSLKWGYDVGGGGWGNNELQFYTEGDNALIRDGKLFIEVRKEDKGDRHYTSTRLVSKNKGDFLYGRFEARAKIPKGRGLWPAIWMLPTDWAYGNWPRSGEIDIMEEVGFDPDRFHISMHTEAYNHVKGTQKTATTVIPDATADFHVFRVDWTPEDIRGFIDDKLIFTFVNEHKTAAEWPFDKRFHWLLNVAVGGNWGGQKGVDDSIFPAAMQVDYVRVYRLKQ